MADFRFPGSPPKEALDWFRAKGFKVGFDYRDVWREQHAHAFTVAKAMKMDVLTSIRESLDDALANGKTFAQWKKELQPELERLGWWGQQEMTDPVTGEIRKVQLGSPRRLKTIYSTNLRTARAAGQWQRIQRSKRAMPYLVYELGPSEKHRAEHKSWAGILLPADDPFWQTHYPPNGWGCKCRIRQVSKREYDRLKASGDYQTTAPKITTKPWTNDRTGEVLNVPKGIDPGWDYNPGMHQGKALAQNEQRSQQAMDKALTAPVPEKPLLTADKVFSTAKGIDSQSMAKALAEIPGASDRVALLAEFVEVANIKTLMVKDVEMRNGKTGRRIAADVGEFLGGYYAENRLYAQRAFTPDKNPKTLGGFTSRSFDHIVVKVQSNSKVDVIALDDLVAAVGFARLGVSKNRLLWSISGTARLIHNAKTGADVDAVVSTWIHEMGHQVHYKAGLGGVPGFAPGSLTEYGSSNEREWHAEHFAAWLLNRDELAKWSQPVANYFDQLIQQALANVKKDARP